MDSVAAKLTPRLAAGIDELVANGWFANRSEAVRAAVRDMLERKQMQRLQAAVDDDLKWAKRD